MVDALPGGHRWGDEKPVNFGYKTVKNG